MTLSDLQLTPGSSFQIDCRIRYPRRRTANNGMKYLSFEIEDCSRSLKAYAWAEQCVMSAQIHDLDKVLISGKVREFNGNPLAAVKNIQSIKSVVTGAANLIPHSLSPEPQLLGRLSSLVSRIVNKPLRCFLDSVFSDDRFTLRFIRLPASRRHHHAEGGGLLKHSLECAEMVHNFRIFSPDMRELAAVGALLHDAGKVMTLHSRKFSPEYVLLDHDALTLEVLAPHLRHLDSISRETATALRYLWSWRHSRRARVHPALIVAEAITAVDRISAGLDLEEEEFSGRPRWQTIMRSQVNGTMLWRPQLGCSA